MFNISFMNGYLKNKVSKKVTINIFGILEFDLSISKFEFKIDSNTLKIKDQNKIVLKIEFNEVRNVEVIDNGKICIYFNINEVIIIK